MIRPLHLTDVAVLLLFLGKSPVNEARARGRLSYKEKASPLAVPALMSGLISRDRRHSLVYAHRGLIRGLVYLRRCGGPSVWEIEHLLLAPGHEKLCVDLLEMLGSARDEIGVERLFLRLDSSSPLVDTARQAGFSHYLTEILYCLEGTSPSGPPELLPTLRPRSSADEYKLFRLFTTAVPIQVRSVEGMTFQEWKHSGDRAATKEFVVENRNEISAWLRIRFEGVAGQFDIVTTLETTELGQLVSYCLSILRGRYPIYCLVPEFQPQLQRILKERGFHRVAEYSCLSKQLAVRAREPQLVPIRA